MKDGVIIKSPNRLFLKREGASVTDEAGNEIPNVRSVTIKLDACDATRASIDVFFPDVDVVAEADFFVTTFPSGKKYKLIPLEES